MTPVDLISAARALIVARGWGQGSTSLREGLCAYEALILAADGPGVSPPVFLEAKGLLTDKLRRKYWAWEPRAGERYSLIEWNDRSGTKAEDVLALFDETIAEASA